MSTVDAGPTGPAASLPVQRATSLPPVPPRRLGLGAPLSAPEPPPPAVQRVAAEDEPYDLGEFAVPEHHESATITVPPPERPLLGDLPMPIRQQSRAPHIESGTSTPPVAPRPVAPSSPAPTVARLIAANQPAHPPAHQPRLLPVQRTVAELSHQPAPQPAPVTPAEPVVQTVTVQRVETAAPAAPSAPTTPAPEDLLAKLYDPLLRRLRTELRVERDRRGTLTDLRH